MGRGRPGTTLIATRFNGRRSITLVTGRLFSGHRALAGPATARENLLVRLISGASLGDFQLGRHGLVVPDNSHGVASHERERSCLILLVCPVFLWESRLIAECEDIKGEGTSSTELEFVRRVRRVLFHEDR